MFKTPLHVDIFVVDSSRLKTVLNRAAVQIETTLTRPSVLRQAALLLSKAYTDLWSIRENIIDYSPTGKNVGEDSCPDLKSYRTSSQHKVIDVFWCFLFVLSSQNVYVGFLAVSSRIYLIKIDKNQPFIAHVDKYTYSAPWDLSNPSTTCEIFTGSSRQVGRAFFHWRNVPPRHHSCEQAPDVEMWNQKMMMVRKEVIDPLKTNVATENGSLVGHFDHFVMFQNR